MKKSRILPVLLVFALIFGLLGTAGFSLIANADDIPDAGVPDKDSVVVNKTATANDDGTYTITLDAYATGSKIVSTINKDVPTDIVLVIDQSGSMEYCIGCGKQIKQNGKTHTIYSKVTSIDTSKTYYIKSTYGNNNYTRVTYCNGTHTSYGRGGGSTTNCAGGAGWYTSTQANQHTSSNKYTPKTAENPDGTQFYERIDATCTSRLSALNTAVTTFVNSVNQKAKGEDGVYGTSDDVNHRIAVVGFATGSYTENSRDYPAYGNTELFIGATQYGYNSASRYYSSAFQDMNTEAGYNNVIASKNAFDAKGATHVDLGIELANGIFKANPISAGENRNRVMIVFTDGAPSSWSSYDATVASNAISAASTTKNTYNATVYAVGIFDGADATSAGNSSGTDEQKANYFMQNVSSNNGVVRNPSYYLSAGDSTSLNNIFQQIADQIESGGSSTTLNEEAVIRDIVAPQFQLPEGTSPDSITLSVASCTGVDSSNEYTWSAATAATGVSAIIGGDDTVSVTGFDFSQNWVGTETSNGVTTYRGSKLIISFKVEVRDGFLGGNDVYTNTSAGVYENANATTPIATFPQPTVNVAIKPVTVTAGDKKVYLLEGVTAEELQSGVTVHCGNVELKLGEENYGLEDWQNAYVDIEVEYVETGYSNLTDDTTYTVKVTVSPKTDGSSTDQGEVATAQEGTATGNILVFKPVLTYVDSTVYYGDVAPMDYSANLTAIVWKHGTTVADASMGAAPALALTYTPESGKIVDGKIATKQDIPVDVAVKIGSVNVTGHTTFLHTDCSGKSCGTPNNGKFWLHVNTCTLTITKVAASGTTIGMDEYFVFNVYKDNAFYTQVTVQGTGSVTISELPVGSYSIREDASTAWRYNGTVSAGVTLSASNTSGTITCTNTKTNEHWVNHFNRVINIFGATPNEN